LYKHGHNSYTPMGTWQTFLTKTEIDYIHRYNIGSFEIEDAVWWRPDKKVKPLCLPIHHLYELKEKATGMEREVIKRILNGGFYGKFIQLSHTKDLGEHFFPPWAAEIEARNRIRVASTCVANNITPISIAVDGIVTERPIQAFDGGKIGNWKLSSVGPVLAVSSSIVAKKNDKPRGEFSADYAWLMGQIAAHPDWHRYVKKKYSAITLPLACSIDQLNRLGDIIEISRTFDVTSETKRLFMNRPPASGRELLENKYPSFPLDTSIISVQDRMRSCP